VIPRRIGLSRRFGLSRRIRVLLTVPPHAVAAVTIEFKEHLFGVRRPDAALASIRRDR